MAWYDFFRLFTYSFTQDPISQKSDKKRFSGVGHTQGDIPDLRGQDSLTAGGNSYIRIQDDLIDLTTTTSRVNRYKEYDRIAASMPEVDTAMTVIADEACVAGTTKIETVYFGKQSIEWLAKNKTGERFSVYSYDFEKDDYTIGWAYDPRYVKDSPTLRILLDNGEIETVTEDHRLLLRNGEWKMAGQLDIGDELMPFYRLKANQNLTKLYTKQYPRILTFKNSWTSERQVIDEWRTGKELPEYKKFNKLAKLFQGRLSKKSVVKLTRHAKATVEANLRRQGFSSIELKHLAKRYKDRRRVIGIHPGPIVPVYDLSVEKHKNFCTNNLVMHNCQRDDEGYVFKIKCKNSEVIDELKFLYFNRKMLNFSQRHCWDKFRRICIKGDGFWEIVLDPDNPKAGIQSIQDLPPETMYRIETTKGKVIEFQQAKEGPDYEAIKKAPVEVATDADLEQSMALRFTPDEIVHIRIGDYRKSFYPYGVGLIEVARGPAHSLRMMEDSMIVYRLSRAPERRIFYIDIGNLSSSRAEAFMDRVKDQLKKKKVNASRSSSTGGASAVEEKWHAPAIDEDIWVPVRQGSSTKVDTLPGAQNLGEIDDTVYFRNKLFTALNFPKNFFTTEDPNATRVTLSVNNSQFARFVERLQSYFEEALWELADRHLRLRGFPPESYDDLQLLMTPPSDWRELSRAEINSNRINNANSYKSSQLLPDFDILTRILKYTDEEAEEILSRLKLQKLEDLKLQIIASNPGIIGVGIPGQGETEMGAEPGGPNPALNPQMPGQEVPGQPGQEQPPEMPQANPQAFGKEEAPSMMPNKGQSKPLGNPSEEEINRYDMGLQSYDADQDVEDVDYSEGE